jgi:Holliday junction resolvase RusA-like endonuclease
MTAPVTIIIDGHAVAKGLPRVTRRGFVYTPAATRKYEAHGRMAAQLAMNGRPPITGPVSLFALVELPVPASWSRRKSNAAIVSSVMPTTKPDLNNYLKSALDSINGIVISDDALIVQLEARKRYGVDPKLVLLITPLAALPANGRAAQCRAPNIPNASPVYPVTAGDRPQSLAPIRPKET